MPKCHTPKHRHSLGILSLIMISLAFAGTAVALTSYTITPTLETTNSDPARQRRFDDPAIWIHPTEPTQSLIIGANKADLSGYWPCRINREHRLRTF